MGGQFETEWGVSLVRNSQLPNAMFICLFAEIKKVSPTSNDSKSNRFLIFAKTLPMMIPFKILPHKGYRNSQFQIVSEIDDLLIDFYHEEALIQTITVDSKNATTVKFPDRIGVVHARCSYGNGGYTQKIKIDDEYRLGSSIFKKAFLIDGIPFSFILMQDRMLVYDEKKDLLLTENHYSPTDIVKVHEKCLLFKTIIGNETDGITNLCLYNLESLSGQGELIDCYKEVYIDIERNLFWLFNQHTKSIVCFEIIIANNEYVFNIIRTIQEVDKYMINLNDKLLMIFHYNSNATYCNLDNIHVSQRFDRNEHTAFDHYGNVFELKGSSLTSFNLITGVNLHVEMGKSMNLCPNHYYHIGSDFQTPEIANNINIEQFEAIYPTNLSNEHNVVLMELSSHEKITCRFSIRNVLYPMKETIFIHEIIEEDILNGFEFSLKPQDNNYFQFYKINDNLFYSPKITYKRACSMISTKHGNYQNSITSNNNINIIKYNQDILVIMANNSTNILSGGEIKVLSSNTSIDLMHINNITYLLIKQGVCYSLFLSSNLNQPILDNIQILNINWYKNHKFLWYKGDTKYISGTRYISAFDLSNCRRIFFNETFVGHSLFKDADTFVFHRNYAKSSNNVIFNPSTLEVKGAIIGLLLNESEFLNKILSRREDELYLSIYDNEEMAYKPIRLNIENKTYSESYLSGDGNYLVLREGLGKYEYIDASTFERMHYFTGTFLGFEKNGSLIIESDNRRDVKIIDPKTFEDITPDNYHYYRFMSPDGKLYAQVSLNYKLINLVTNEEVNKAEETSLRKFLDYPSFVANETEKEAIKLRISGNRKYYFDLNKEKIKSLKINNHELLGSNEILKQKKFLKIGITNTNVSNEICLPDDINFYNYSAFSFDNQYFGYVGKPLSRGIIELFKITHDEKLNTINVDPNNYRSYLPSRASWVCGFSKNGYFATYDSIPDTFLIKLNEDIFKNKQPLINTVNRIDYSSDSNEKQDWRIIREKSFLCFSPTGRYMALSEKGYRPKTLGGSGHQESSVVHIALTENGVIINTLWSHGDIIKSNIERKLIFVAFSEDEKKILTHSADGVIILRNINLEATRRPDAVPETGGSKVEVLESVFD
jgi:hypothetical protein